MLKLVVPVVTTMFSTVKTPSTSKFVRKVS